MYQKTKEIRYVTMRLSKIPYTIRSIFNYGNERRENWKNRRKCDL